MPSHDDQAAREKITRLCQSTTVSAKYAEDPSQTPGHIADKLFGSHFLSTLIARNPEIRPAKTTEDLEWAKSCGQFGTTQPSELFLSAFHDVLQCLENDPLANICSPALIGSTGVVAATAIAPLNDQLRHISNLIVRAEKEVLLATNFWKSSGASHFINDALIELSKRAGARGERVVVRLMYDRGALMQVFDPHQNVDAKGWQAPGVGLPPQEDFPNVDFAIVNFHRPPLGTFHSKFLIVDRKIACISSHNIQDNQNLEMMSHLEGPIVDAIWESFVVSWHNKLEPPLPTRNVRAADFAPPTLQEPSFRQLFDEKGAFRLPEHPIESVLPEHVSGEPHYDNDLAGEIQRMRSVLQPIGSETHVDAVCRHLNKPTKLSIKPTAPPREPDLHFFPYIPVPQFEPVPMAMCSRKPFAGLNNESLVVPQNEAWLSLIQHAKHDIFIQTPDLNAKALLPALIDAVKRGVEITYYVCLGYNDAGELLPGQGGTNEMAAHHLLQKSDLTDAERKLLKIFFYVAADQDHPISDQFKQRSCHIKLMIVDASVAVQGSGNQDTQSWYHSNEINVMIDSPTVCAAWREGIERNQNTAQFGRMADDGCWYDGDGNLAAGSFGLKTGAFTWAKGITGMLKKAQGK